MPPSEITATSEVPPPTSTTIRPTGSAIGRPAPIAAAERLLDQVHLARARGQRRLLDRAALDVGHARRRAHDQPRAAEAALQHLVDELAEHRLGDLEVGDHAVAQRAVGGDRGRACGRSSAGRRRRRRAPRRCAGRSRRPTARTARSRARARRRPCSRCRGRSPCRRRRGAPRTTSGDDARPTGTLPVASSSPHQGSTRGACNVCHMPDATTFALFAAGVRGVPRDPRAVGLLHRHAQPRAGPKGRSDVDVRRPGRRARARRGGRVRACRR